MNNGRNIKKVAEINKPISEIREWLVNNANPYTRVEISMDGTKIVAEEMSVPTTTKEN